MSGRHNWTVDNTASGKRRQVGSGMKGAWSYCSVGGGQTVGGDESGHLRMSQVMGKDDIEHTEMLSNHEVMDELMRPLQE